MPQPDLSISTSARRIIEAFGQDAAGAAFNMALKISTGIDNTAEARWLEIAIEIMRLQSERRETVAQIVRFAALGAAAVR